MAVKQAQYESVLAKYSGSSEAINLLKQYRPYLSLLPSMRRPEKSLVTIPLPVVRLTKDNQHQIHSYITGKTATTQILPCEIAILMCDPEWKIKLDVEIMVFIYRPDESFSDLLLRWRHTQVALDNNYEWLMPDAESHMISEIAGHVYPLFIIFPDTPELITKGLQGANLPYVISVDINTDLDNHIPAVPSAG